MRLISPASAHARPSQLGHLTVCNPSASSSVDIPLALCTRLSRNTTPWLAEVIDMRALLNQIDAEQSEEHSGLRRTRLTGLVPACDVEGKEQDPQEQTAEEPRSWRVHLEGAN